MGRPSNDILEVNTSRRTTGDEEERQNSGKYDRPE